MKHAILPRVSDKKSFTFFCLFGLSLKKFLFEISHLIIVSERLKSVVCSRLNTSFRCGSRIVRASILQLCSFVRSCQHYFSTFLRMLLLSYAIQRRVQQEKKSNQRSTREIRACSSQTRFSAVFKCFWHQTVFLHA